MTNSPLAPAIGVLRDGVAKLRHAISDANLRWDDDVFRALSDTSLHGLDAEARIALAALASAEVELVTALRQMEG